METNIDYKEKYLKYKQKYLNFKNLQSGGAAPATAAPAASADVSSFVTLSENETILELTVETSDKFTITKTDTDFSIKRGEEEEPFVKIIKKTTGIVLEDNSDSVVIFTSDEYSPNTGTYKLKCKENGDNKWKFATVSKLSDDISEYNTHMVIKHMVKPDATSAFAKEPKIADHIHCWEKHIDDKRYVIITNKPGSPGEGWVDKFAGMNKSQKEEYIKEYSSESTYTLHEHIEGTHNEHKIKIFKFKKNQ